MRDGAKQQKKQRNLWRYQLSGQGYWSDKWEGKLLQRNAEGWNDPRKGWGLAKQWCACPGQKEAEGPDPELMLTRFNVPGYPPRPCCLGISPSRREALHVPVYRSNKALRSKIWNLFLNGDIKKVPRSYFYFSHMLEKPNGQFPTFNMVELFWAVLQPASVPFDDNGSERMGTLLRLGIAVKSIWRRPSPFYPARTSSALESCSFLARLPSSPQVVSESHPPAICCWLGFPPEILGKEKKKERKNP